MERMNKLIAVLLLSTVTCFGGGKFVSGKFVHGAMSEPLPDLIVNGTTYNIASGGTYQYNNIILTNGGSITITGTNIAWTTIICNNLKLYSTGSTYDGITINDVYNISAVTVSKTAIDGQVLSATLPAHAVNPVYSRTGGNGGDSQLTIGGIAPGFIGGVGADGYDDYANLDVFGGTGGTWGQAGNTPAFYANLTSVCTVYSFYGAGGGGGGAGISKGLLYLRVRSAFTDTSDGDISINGNGLQGGNGGDGGVYEVNAFDSIYEGSGGNGGAGGTGATIVFRSPTGSFMQSYVNEGAGGFGGGPGNTVYNNVCVGWNAGNYGLDGENGITGTITVLSP